MKAEHATLIEKSLEDPVFFCNTFLSHWFFTKGEGENPIPWFHRAILGIMTRKVAFLEKYGEIDKILEHFPKNYYKDEEGKLCLRYHTNTLLMIPRNFAKTTVTRAFIIYSMLLQLKKVILFISQTTGHSKAECNQIKNEFEVNEMIRAVFGDFVPKRNESPSRKWTDDEIQLKNDTFLISKSTESQVRGTNRGGRRPDLIVMDDLENETTVQTEEQRLKVKRWCYSAVFPALDDTNEQACVICCGTLLHRDALIAYLERDPDWVCTKFGAVLADGSPLWPVRKPLEWIERKKQQMALAGELESFYLEYMNEVRPMETAIFKPEYFIPKPAEPHEFVARSIALDPAIGKSIRADFCAYAICGKTNKGYTHVIDTFAKRGMKPSEQVNKFFELSKRYEVHYHGVEAIAYQAALISMIQEQMYREQWYFEVVPIKHGKTRKEDRIRGAFAARAANDWVRFQKKEPMLITQCLDFPAGVHDDLPDVVSMAIMLLDDKSGYADPGRAELYQTPVVQFPLGACP